MLRRTTSTGYLRKTQARSLTEANGVMYRNRQLGATMHQWHSGMGDPIYAVGSMIYAGKHVEREDAEDAISALEALLRAAQGADKKELQGLIRELKKGLGESVEPTLRRTVITEAGLRKTTSEAFGGKTYDVKVKPLLNKIGPLKKGGDLKALKAAIDAAHKAGATPKDIADAVGGPSEWNKIVRALKKASLA